MSLGTTMLTCYANEKVFKNVGFWISNGYLMDCFNLKVPKIVKFVFELTDKQNQPIRKHNLYIAQKRRI